ncbi:peptidylprolyl isomerase [Pontiellaceae bacterium B1224]|nr:peptidylprolyl isomerase [Pontiellaceae bacterium B1224]
MGTWLKIIGALLMVQAAAAELTNGLYAAFDTTMGSFTCRLDYAEAPLTCANFVGLAEGSQHWVSTDGAVRSDPFYDGLIFHRVIDGFMIQGGCPLGNGTGGPGYAFPDELVPTADYYSNAGILVMANSGTDSNGSQFFITLVSHPSFDDVSKYMVFGEVAGGMNVVSSIGSVATDASDRPLTNVVMRSVEILRIGAEAEAFSPLDEPLPKVTPLALTLSGDVTAGTSNQCEQLIYSSPNLINWTLAGENYSPTAGEDISLAVSTNHACRFYRGAQVFYPQASTWFSNLEGKSISFTKGTNTFEFCPAANGLGTCTIAGTPDTLSYWEEWTTEPYVSDVVFKPSGFNAFRFIRPRSGAYSGYQYSAFGWQYTGLWEFSDKETIPE